jgi:hypothetical protein
MQELRAISQLAPNPKGLEFHLFRTMRKSAQTQETAALLLTLVHRSFLVKVRYCPGDKVAAGVKSLEKSRQLLVIAMTTTGADIKESMTIDANCYLPDTRRH